MIRMLKTLGKLVLPYFYQYHYMIHAIHFIAFQMGVIPHQNSEHLVPHDESDAVDLHSNLLGDRHHFSPPHSVPLHILHLNRKGHQVGAFEPTALGECVGAGALEIKFPPIKRAVMGITRGMAHTLTNRVTFLDAFHYLTLLIWAT